MKGDLLVCGFDTCTLENELEYKQKCLELCNRERIWNVASKKSDCTSMFVSRSSLESFNSKMLLTRIVLRNLLVFVSERRMKFAQKEWLSAKMLTSIKVLF